MERDYRGFQRASVRVCERERVTERGGGGMTRVKEEGREGCQRLEKMRRVSNCERLSE